MAGIARPLRRTAPISHGDRQANRVFLILDLLVGLALLAAIGILYFFYPEVWGGAIAAFGYGWLPALAWTGAALLTLRYRSRWLARYWNLWLAGAGLAAFTIGLLSFWDADYGPLAFTGLAGSWGRAAMGDSTFLAVARLVPLALAIPLAALPYRVSRAYWSALRWTGIGLWLALGYLVWGTRVAANAVCQSVANLCRRETRPRWVTALLQLPGRLATALARRSSPPAAVPVAVPPAELEHGMVAETPETNEPPEAVVAASPAPLSVPGSKWKLPSMDLLAPADVHSTDERALKKMGEDIENALADHGLDVQVADIKAGPRIVRFGLRPGWTEKRGSSRGKDGQAEPERSRVRVQSILSRERDLSLAISAPSLRFEQVPGEALLGVEVPTPSPSKVTMREVMDSADFRKFAAKGGLPIALGADAGGASVAMDLAGLPHMMIAGATGSGKSVCINSIVASILLTKPPDQLRMVMVDPKQVELTPFNGIPHLVLPVITEVDDVSPMLRGLIREMTRRYKSMAELGVRNIVGYNAKSRDPMPYLVLIVDELADLMLVGGFEIEQSLVRLAQLGRAAGIHLVLATQRPSVKVVTGLLKANIPARVAFAVASQVDARVVLDTVGAEKLLGKGDMLLLNNDSPKPRRVQGTLVLDDEIEKLVDFWLDQKGPPLPAISLEDGEEGVGELEEGLDENLLDKARELALRNPNLTSSLLERRLKIGSARASQIVEALEDEGLLIPR